MNTINFVVHQKVNPSLLQVSDLKLIHDEDLTVTWQSGKVWSQDLWPNRVGGGYSHIINWPNASTCIEVAMKIIDDNPDYYTSDDFKLLLQYERLTIAIPKAYVDQMLNSPSGFTSVINDVWVNQYRVNLGKYLLQSIGPVQNPSDGWDSEIFMNFTPVIPPTELTDLCRAAQTRRYVLFQHGIGVYAPGKPAILHTNAKEEYVEHPQLGRVPAGLQYIDFNDWDGANKDYTKEDLKTTG